MADGGQGIDGVDYLGKLLRIRLGFEAAVLVGDEAEEVALGSDGGGLRLVCEGGAGDSSVAPPWETEDGSGGKETTVGRHVYFPDLSPPMLVDYLIRNKGKEKLVKFNPLINLFYYILYCTHINIHIRIYNPLCCFLV